MPPLTLAMTDRRGAGRSAMVTCVATLPDASPDRRAPRRSSKGPSCAPARREASGQRRDVFGRSRRPPGRAHSRAAGPLGGENQRPNGSRNGSQEKIAGARSDSGDWDCLGFSRLRMSGGWDSNPRRPAWEEGGKQGLTAGYFAVSSSANGSRNGSRELSS